MPRAAWALPSRIPPCRACGRAPPIRTSPSPWGRLPPERCQSLEHSPGGFVARQLARRHCGDPAANEALDPRRDPLFPACGDLGEQPVDDRRIVERAEYILQPFKCFHVALDPPARIERSEKLRRVAQLLGGNATT